LPFCSAFTYYFLTKQTKESGECGVLPFSNFFWGGILFGGISTLFPLLKIDLFKADVLFVGISS